MRTRPGIKVVAKFVTRGWRRMSELLPNRYVLRVYYRKRMVVLIMLTQRVDYRKLMWP